MNGAAETAVRMGRAYAARAAPADMRGSGYLARIRMLPQQPGVRASMGVLIQPRVGLHVARMKMVMVVRRSFLRRPLVMGVIMSVRAGCGRVHFMSHARQHASHGRPRGPAPSFPGLLPYRLPARVQPGFRFLRIHDRSRPAARVGLPLRLTGAPVHLPRRVSRPHREAPQCSICACDASKFPSIPFLTCGARSWAPQGVRRNYARTHTAGTGRRDFSNDVRQPGQRPGWSYPSSAHSRCSSLLNGKNCLQSRQLRFLA